MFDTLQTTACLLPPITTSYVVGVHITQTVPAVPHRRLRFGVGSAQPMAAARTVIVFPAPFSLCTFHDVPAFHAPAPGFDPCLQWRILCGSCCGCALGCGCTCRGGVLVMWYLPASRCSVAGCGSFPKSFLPPCPGAFDHLELSQSRAATKLPVIFPKIWRFWPIKNQECRDNGQLSSSR